MCQLMKKYIHAAQFFFTSGVKTGGYLAINDGKFGEYVTQRPEDGEIIEYPNSWIAPGLVDTHIHGYKNHDVMDNDPKGIQIMSEALLECGVTSFLPTTLTSSRERLLAVAKTVGEVAKQVTGAKIPGMYFEGPFFTEKYKGAQNANYFSDPSLEVFHQWQKASGGLIKKIALAPERQGVEGFVEALTKEGVVVALGHSDATYQQAQKAVDAGASVFVHAFNGMRGFTHRELGMAGAMLNIKEVFAELIADGHHVHPKAVELLIQSIGYEKVALITDCMMAGGMPDGDYVLGEFPVKVANGTARLKEGNLAGSILKLYQGMQNVVKWGIATPYQAVMMASYIPAVSCNISDVCGEIRKDRAADFIVLDQQMNLQATYLDGIKRFDSNEK